MDMYRGDSFRATITVTNPEGAPYDLTGARLWFTAKRAITDPDTDAVLAKDTSDGTGSLSVSDTTGGLADLEIFPADTQALDLTGQPLKLTCDLQIKDGAGRIYTTRTEPLTIKPDVARAV